MIIQFDDDFVLYSLDEVSRRTGVARYRLEELVRTDELAGVIHAGRWMVEQAEIDRFLREWTPPVRPSLAGVTRRFRPPEDLPAEL